MTNSGRLPFLYDGEVTNRTDPDGLGRVKIKIEGIVEPETPNWAEPIGVQGGGHANRGTFEPPRIGANVSVMFKHGDPDFPRYMPGPWGAPGGVVDTPTNAAVEDDDRQNAVTEDEEWRVERDSRDTTTKYLIRHRNSDLAVLIDAENDKVLLVREGATEALVLGTTYRTNEAAYLSAIESALGGLVGALAAFDGDATFKAAFGTLASTLLTASTTLQTALGSLPSSDMSGDATAYLSDKAFTE
jgi:hypothetical protein